MANLQEDIKQQSAWIIKAFAADNLQLDYTIHSFIEIDKFFNLHAKDGKAVKRGRLSANLGVIIFSVGAYVGETIIKTIPGAVWQTDDNDPEGEFTASVQLPDGVTAWPMQKVAKRFQQGAGDSIYVYGHRLTADKTQELFDNGYWEMEKATAQPVAKPWWKFW